MLASPLVGVVLPGKAAVAWTIAGLDNKRGIARCVPCNDWMVQCWPTTNVRWFNCCTPSISTVRLVTACPLHATHTNHVAAYVSSAGLCRRGKRHVCTTVWPERVPTFFAADAETHGHEHSAAGTDAHAQGQAQVQQQTRTHTHTHTHTQRGRFRRWHRAPKNDTGTCTLHGAVGCGRTQRGCTETEHPPAHTPKKKERRHSIRA